MILGLRVTVIAYFWPSYAYSNGISFLLFVYLPFFSRCAVLLVATSVCFWPFWQP